MSTNYYVKGTGVNPEELSKLEQLRDDLEDNDLPVPKELMDRLENPNEFFNVYLDTRALKKGLERNNEGNIIIDLDAFKGVKFIEFGSC